MPYPPLSSNRSHTTVQPNKKRKWTGPRVSGKETFDILERNKQRRKGNVVTIPPPTLSLSLFLSVLVSSPYSPNRLPSFAFFLFAKKNRLYPTWSSRNKKRKQYRDRNYRVSGKHVTLAYSIYRPFPISSSLQPKKIEGAMAGSKEVCFCLLLILVSLSRTSVCFTQLCFLSYQKITRP